MEVIILYLVFAFTTALVATYYINTRVVRALFSGVIEPVPEIVANGNRYMVLFVIFVINFIFAPITFIVFFSKKQSEIFIATLDEELKKP